MPRPSAVSAGVTTTLGYLLVVVGGEKLNGLHWWLDPVFRLGMSDSVVHLVGWGEVLVGVLLVHRPFRGWGTRLFVAWMAGALTTHIAAGDVPGAVVAASVLALGIVISLQPGPEDMPWYDRVPAPLLRVPAGAGPTTAYLALRIGAAFLFRWAVGGVVFWLALPVLGVCHLKRATSVDRASPRLHPVLLYLLFFGLGIEGLWAFARAAVEGRVDGVALSWAAAGIVGLFVGLRSMRIRSAPLPGA